MRFETNGGVLKRHIGTVVAGIPRKIVAKLFGFGLCLAIFSPAHPTWAYRHGVTLFVRRTEFVV